MVDRDGGAAVVVYAGRGAPIDPDGRFRLERVEPETVTDYARIADCVVLEQPGGGLAALASLGGRSVPTLLYDRHGDPAVAAEATRLGVTEYVTDRSLGGDRLADRIAALAGIEGVGADERRAAAAAETLRPAQPRTDRSVEASIERLLEAGRRRFGLRFGGVGRIDGEEYAVVAGDLAEGETVPLAGTLCRLPADRDGPFRAPDTAWTLECAGLAEPFARLRSYVGAPVAVGGDRYGTVWFGDERPRPAFTDGETAFLERLAALVGRELEIETERRGKRDARARTERALGALSEAGERFRSVAGPEAVARITAETAVRATDADVGVVRLEVDGETVTATAGEAADIELPAVSPALPAGGRLLGDGGGEAAVRSATATVAVGDRGVAAIGDRSGSLDGADRRALSVLAADADAALSRLDRRRRLCGYESLESLEGRPAALLSEGEIEFATAAFLERFGYDHGDLRGTATAAVFGSDLAESAATDCEGPVTVGTAVRGADGTETRVEAELFAADGGARTAVRIPEGRPADPDRGRFRSLFDQLPDPVVDVEFADGDPIVRGVNGAFEETFGYGERDVTGRSLEEVIVPAGREAGGERLAEAAVRQGYDAAEVERLTAEGQRTFLFRGFSYRYRGTERGFGIYTDITDRLEQQRRLRVLHRVLRHNLRNEMTAITGFADMLSEEAPSAESREYAERIYERATDVSKLGEQVRRIAQALDVDRQQVALDPEPLVDDIVAWFRSNYPSATVRVSASGDGEIVADELLKTAIENLVENAIEHHPGDPTIEIELAAVDERWFDITVRDDGPGIPERERAVVGGDREITQLDHSMGLGLWVSRWVVSGVGGELVFGDGEGGGEVTLRLRRADGADDPTPP